MKFFDHQQDFSLESGTMLPGLCIAYDTYGQLNAAKDNVVWVCHALTASSDAADWWKGLIGEGCLINPEKYFIVCANMPGSCYGSTGPVSNNPQTNQPYYSSFPLVTIRDMVSAFILLRKHLGIDKIALLMGGSMGGYQVLEWTVMEKEVIENQFLIATSPSESAWGVAVHTAQRLAIEADNSWLDHSATAGAKGLKAARAIGMLTYRNYNTFQEKQTDPDPEKTDDFKASSYLNYQGDKLVKRFNAFSYWLLTKAMDSHHLGRGRGGDLIKVLQSIQQPTFIMGIRSDILCPLDEQRFMAEHIPNAKLIEIDSAFGHDGFIIETAQISRFLGEWLQTNKR
ncbi:MAG: homoserine O-acetyltransferase [Chitinophagaceae bacterium]|nr:homoserine O-acetyltransferase [Chitinophagaceae bacterium]MDP1764400.1 homoserine O-acetyltransferase [Sediminibacterium sp.]MDP3666896.1 homoserine O-acetyltransferase [Sediminibacterium sp.]